MSFSKIICLNFTGAELEASYWEEMDALAKQRVNADRNSASGHPDADALLVKLGAKVDKSLMDALPSLKYIGMLGTGYGGIDTTYAASKGIAVTNIADYATSGVAEFTFGVILEHFRDITKAKRQAEAGDYTDNFSGREVNGKTFGVIGLGNIGRRIAELAQAFGAKVTYWSRERKTESEAKGISYLEIEKLLADSDIVTLNLALNPDTEGFLTAERIEKIKAGGILVNTSPMELIDFEALVKRLKKNDLTFILDHSDEMDSEQLEILRPLGNCIIYPPIGYLTQEASQLKKRLYVDNLKNFLAGKPTNKVN